MGNHNSSAVPAEPEKEISYSFFLKVLASEVTQNLGYFIIAAGIFTTIDLVICTAVGAVVLFSPVGAIAFLAGVIAFGALLSAVSYFANEKLGRPTLVEQTEKDPRLQKLEQELSFLEEENRKLKLQFDAKKNQTSDGQERNQDDSLKVAPGMPC